MAFSTQTISALAALGIIKSDDGRIYRDDTCAQAYWPIADFNELVAANGVCIVYTDGTRLIRGGAAFTRAWNAAIVAAAGNPLTAMLLSLEVAKINGVSHFYGRTNKWNGAIISTAPIAEPSVIPNNILAIFAVPTTAASTRMTYIPAAIGRQIARGSWDRGASWSYKYNDKRVYGLVMPWTNGNPAIGQVVGPNGAQIGPVMFEGSSPILMGSTALKLCTAGQLYDRCTLSIEHRDESEVVEKIAEARAAMIAIYPENTVLMHWLRFACFSNGVGIMRPGDRTRTMKLADASESSFDGLPVPSSASVANLSSDGMIGVTIDGVYDSVGVLTACWNRTNVTPLILRHRQHDWSTMPDLTNVEAPLLDQSVHSVAKLIGPSAVRAGYTDAGVPRTANGASLNEHMLDFKDFIEADWIAPDRDASLQVQSPTVNGVPTPETAGDMETRLTTAMNSSSDLLDMSWMPERSVGPRLEQLAVLFGQMMQKPPTAAEAATVSGEAQRQYWISQGWYSY